MLVVGRYSRWDIVLWLGAFMAIPLLSANGRALQQWLFSTFEVTVLAWGIGLALFVLVLNAIVWLARKRRDKGWWLTALVGFVLLAVLLSVVSLLPRVEEQVHFITFGLFGFLTGRVTSLSPAIIVVLGLSAGDELLQAWLPDRVGDWRDVAMNALAAGMGLVISVLGSQRRG